jgi:hypothetical protein
MLRRVLTCLFLIMPLAAGAQLKLEPLPAPPPPPPGTMNAPGDEQITINPGPNDQVEEFIVDGQRNLKVTRPDGSVYYLIQDQRDAGVRSPTDSGIRVPLWVIKKF